MKFKSKRVYRGAGNLWLVLAALFIGAGCGNNQNTHQTLNGCSGSSSCQDSQNLFQGSWKLFTIRCDGQPSPTLSDSTLQDDSSGFSLVVNYSGSTGKREFKIGACTVTYPMKNVIYGDSTVEIAEDQAVCSGDCAAFSAQCGAAGNTTTFPFQISKTELVLTIPKTDNTLDPCNANWAKKIEFTYKKL